jgi:hypothetical protein
VPTEKDMQLEKWWQDNLKAIVLLLRKDPDFKVLISPFQ